MPFGGVKDSGSASSAAAQASMNSMSIATGASPIQPEPELARTDDGGDRRQRRHRAGDGPPGPSRRRRRSFSPPVIPTGSSKPHGSWALRHTAAFDAIDFDRLGKVFDELPGPIDHVLVGPALVRAAGGIRFRRGPSGRRGASCFCRWRWLGTRRGRFDRVEPCVFMSGTGGRATAVGFALISALTGALPALTRNLALELAPIRVNLIAAGFVDTPLSASLLGDHLDARREELRTTLPVRRVIGPADIAALAVHLMTNTAVTGATYDIDGGQQLVEGEPVPDATPS